MPKMNDRERLAKLEADQTNLARETLKVRHAVRGQYGALTCDIAVEKLSEREFKDVLGQAIRVGGAAAIAALKAVAGPVSPASASPEGRPSDEHGGAARRRPAPLKGAASAGDGTSQ